MKTSRALNRLQVSVKGFCSEASAQTLRFFYCVHSSKHKARVFGQSTPSHAVFRFSKLLCLADFVTDIVAAQSLAHRSDPVLVHFGYAAPALLGLTVVNSCMILALRCCYREFFEGVVRKDRLRWHVWSLLALTNPEILNSFLAYLHSNMSIEEKHEATLVRLSIKKLGVVSQLVEDIPQTAIQANWVHGLESLKLRVYRV